MRSRTLTAIASALLLVAAALVEANGIHSHLQVLHRRHHARRDPFTSPADIALDEIDARSLVSNAEIELEKRGGQCEFPANVGLVAVTPGSQNAGWAMSPNQPCLPGNYCPYACPPGQLSMQWDPAATSYTYPQSMNGGLYCDNDGTISKPFPNQPYCAPGTGSVTATNTAGGGVVSFCQTVLPGNEAMLIPTSVESLATLAVPDTSYWCGTAAHFYINPPGVGTDQACGWGSSSSPVGNWSPYVAGANTDATGRTFVKLGWNPIYLEPATPFRNTMPTWGVKITCSGSGCNGLPCAIDPSQNSVNEMLGSATDGAGGGAFCVVTVPKGLTANFEVFESGGGSSSSSSQIPSGMPGSAPSGLPFSQSGSAGPGFPSWGASPQRFYATSANSSHSSSIYSSPSSPSTATFPVFVGSNSTSTYVASAVASTTAPSTNTSISSGLFAAHTGSASALQIALDGIAISIVAAVWGILLI